WQNWVTIRRTGLTLAAGWQTWRLVLDTNGVSSAVGNFNHLRLVSAGANEPPTASITSPSSGASYTAPASITINALASDPNGTVSRVEFYAGSQLLGTDSSTPYSFTWSNVAAGTYSLSVIAFDDGGASSPSASIPVTVNATSEPPSTTIVFNPSVNHDTAVTSYSVAIYRAGDPTTATPAATRNLGKPAPSNNEISVNISDIVNPLPGGSYYAVVTASGPGGAASSTPTSPFTK
ncbi:MAG: hypothetical protein LC804_27515, partial [Acidobacteria bacterium]|nr:hypothetical protein [Acidobacteriota bacterium]